ncbi:hypothetical protein ACFRMQ_34890 [Kitasatospora sp. NPDC056783]|uniref:hypothetical protein n=1 Tax=Kitasatospora sp. NPDC056783 TaxID=3345943 RepID=UPI0036C28145
MGATVTPLWEQIRELRGRDERRSRAPGPALELLLVSKVSEEANEAAELYRRSKGWGTDGKATATEREVQHEMCAAIMAGMVALDRLCPDGDAARVWHEYLAYGYERAKAEKSLTIR